MTTIDLGQHHRGAAAVAGASLRWKMMERVTIAGDRPCFTP
jgi:hypothetical protein